MKTSRPLVKIIIALILCVGHSYADSFQNDRFLILHSRPSGDKQVEELKKGIKRVLKTRYSNISVIDTYIDEKLIQKKSYKKSLLDILKHKFGPKNPVAVLSMKESSTKMAESLRVKLDGHFPILNYDGVSSKAFDINLSKELSFKSFIKLLRMNHSKFDTIVPLGLSQKEKKYLKRDILMFKNIRFQNIDQNLKTKNDLFLYAQELSSNNVIIIGSDFSLGGELSDERLSFVEKLSAFSAVPLYTLETSYLDRGVLGGYVKDFYKEGLNAARSLLNSTIEFSRNKGESQNRFIVFDYIQINRFGLNTETLKKSNVKFLNAPKSISYLISKYKFEFTLLGFAFLSLILSLLAAVAYIGQKRKMEKKIKKLNTDLEDRVARRTKQIKDQQSRLAASSKLASLGEMASGVAHEINNPLTVIKMLSKKFKRIENVTDAQNLSIKINEMVDRISEIIVGMKNISRDGKDLPKTFISLSKIIQDSRVLCRNRFHNEGVDLIIKECSQNIMVHCVPVQMSQVFLNLLNNAFDAIIELNLRKDKWIKVETVVVDNKIRINIIDSGTGIPKEVATKILEPFYTTKSAGEGTGLGLSISKRIVERHQGEIFIDDNHKNTCVSILLPIAQVIEKEAYLSEEAS